MSATLSFKFLDRRVLAGLSFVDPLGRLVQRPVAVRAVDPAVKLYAKRAGEIVITDAPGLDQQISSFDPPAPPPALGSIAAVLDVKPADSGLGARRFTLKLPRNSDPARADAVSSFVVVPLLASPAGRVTGLVAAIRVHAGRSSDGFAIEGALVRLRPEGARPEVWGLTDAAGEALLLGAGVPIASPGPGATVQADIGGMVDAIVDPALARFNAPDALQTARREAANRLSGFVDPDDLATRLSATATAPIAVRVAPGQTRTVTIEWTAP
jgi:hypothetical protein